MPKKNGSAKRGDQIEFENTAAAFFEFRPNAMPDFTLVEPVQSGKSLFCSDLVQ